MTDNFAIRREIIDRLGCPEPELPGVQFIGSGSSASYELLELFDHMCIRDPRDRELLERAIVTLERIRAEDYEAFYLGRSELLCMYPVVHEVPSAPAPSSRPLGPMFGSASLISP